MPAMMINNFPWVSASPFHFQIGAFLTETPLSAHSGSDLQPPMWPMLCSYFGLLLLFRTLRYLLWETPGVIEIDLERLLERHLEIQIRPVVNDTRTYLTHSAGVGFKSGYTHSGNRTFLTGLRSILSRVSGISDPLRTRSNICVHVAGLWESVLSRVFLSK